MTTKTMIAKGVITSSYILYLIDYLLDKSDRMNGSTIRLKQMLFGRTKVPDAKIYIDMSNTAWQSVVKEYEDANMRLVLAHAVEQLFFKEEEAMVAMYGQSINDIVCRFVDKHMRNDIDSALIRETNLICMSLNKALKKAVFDNKREL